MLERKNLRASERGLETIKAAIQERGWNLQSARLYQTAKVSEATLKRFLRRIPIRRESFISICQSIGIDNWENVIEKSFDRSERSTIVPFAYKETWVGREALVSSLLRKFDSNYRVLLIAGLTGIGKTALAERLVFGLKKDYSKFCRLNFNDETLEDFVSIAANILTDWQEPITSDDRQNPRRILNWLVNYLKTNNCLLLIDSLEATLKGDIETGWSNFRDQQWEKFFQAILASESFNSLIILTSQDLPAELEILSSRYSNLLHCERLVGLTPQEQMELFMKVGLDVTESSLSGNYLRRIGNAYEGHPLALEVIIGEILNTPYNRDVISYWNRYGYEIQRIEKIKNEIELKASNDNLRLASYNRNLHRKVKDRIDKTFEKLYEEVYHAYILLCVSSVYRRPVQELFFWNLLTNLGFTDKQTVSAIDALLDRSLIREEICNTEVLLSQHNLIRDVALEHLKKIKIAYESR
ncbi:ATP-binding protein [Leptolyngbya sp. PL-A3]|uniref:ATP-binding protein n=1 Tax=Leptolyngbya sp. PL-A3 TaxID=2933911 RepID=UPI00329699D3